MVPQETEEMVRNRRVSYAASRSATQAHEKNEDYNGNVVLGAQTSHPEDLDKNKKMIRATDNSQHQTGSPTTQRESGRVRAKNRCHHRDDDIGATRSWNEVSSIIVRAAKEVCGEHSKRVRNPWIIGAEKEPAVLRENIDKRVPARNESTNNTTHRIFKRKLTNARKTLKKKLNHLERKWCENKLEECDAAARAGNFGAMYSLLRQLETRSSKPLEGTTITSENFREHFPEFQHEGTKSTQEN